MHEKRKIKMQNLLIASIVLLMLEYSEGKNRIFGIESNTAIKHFLGKYYFMYGSPKPRTDIPECAEVKFEEVQYNLTEPFSCTCDEIETNLALVRMQMNDFKRANSVLLVKIINNTEEISTAQATDCVCQPNMELTEVIFADLLNDCFLYSEMKYVRKHTFLLCKSKDQIIEDLLNDFKQMKHGKTMCSSPKDIDNKISEIKAEDLDATRKVYDPIYHIHQGWLRNRKIYEMRNNRTEKTFATNVPVPGIRSPEMLSEARKEESPKSAVNTVKKGRSPFTVNRHRLSTFRELSPSSFNDEIPGNHDQDTTLVKNNSPFSNEDNSSVVEKPTTKLVEFKHEDHFTHENQNSLVDKENTHKPIALKDQSPFVDDEHRLPEVNDVKEVKDERDSLEVKNKSNITVTDRNPVTNKEITSAAVNELSSFVVKKKSITVLEDQILLADENQRPFASKGKRSTAVTDQSVSTIKDYNTVTVKDDPFTMKDYNPLLVNNRRKREVTKKSKGIGDISLALVGWLAWVALVGVGDI